ncbi:DUF5990 family protein [Catenulispora rubra]|uniref:DUF5990 family protein n=1 Tax=Catenulispora rubra TaxID=280293 RepID=UPI00189207B2|nr:DUF5990 family protein [Catenulispora rubra]
MLLRIEGRELPGMPGIAVAVQARAKPYALLDPVPGDAAEAAWDLAVEPFTTKHGERTLRGSHVQDGIGGRFVYLSWYRIGEDGEYAMFCRAKLMLSGIPQDVYEAGVASGALLARCGLTNAKGNPVTARLVPPAVEWTAG